MRKFHLRFKMQELHPDDELFESFVSKLFTLLIVFFFRRTP